METDKYSYIGKIIESLHPSVTIADGDGRFVYIGKYGEEFFGVSNDDIIGKSCSDELILNTFKPCVTAMVYEQRKKVETMQKNNDGTETMVTGIPFFEKNGVLEMIVVISSWEISNYDELRTSYNRLEAEVRELTYQINKLQGEDLLPDNILENSRMFKNSQRLLDIFAGNGLSAFIHGPIGSGRKYLARLTYQKKGLLFIYNCELLDEKTIDEELFSTEGLLNSGEEQIAVIENIDSLSPVLQKKLIFFLENKGKRVIAISKSSLEELKNRGVITTEFFDYFHSYQVKVDAISDRPEDLKEFIDYYLDYFEKKYSREMTISTKAMNALLGYEWEGNILEVKSVIERIVLTNEKPRVDYYDLPEAISKQSMEVFANGETLKDMLEFYEKTIIVRAYEKYKTSVEVARQLGISQPSAARKIQKYVRDMKEV